MNLTLRPATPADQEFLFTLFVSSRDIDFSFFPEPQRTAILRMQFDGQWQTYQQRFPAGVHQIICLDGKDAGRIWISETPKEIRILDVALLPEYRNRGIGERIYAGLIAQSNLAGVPLCATVSTANPGSLRFHERFNFRRSGGDGMYISLIRSTGEIHLVRES